MRPTSAETGRTAHQLRIKPAEFGRRSRNAWIKSPAQEHVSGCSRPPGRFRSASGAGSAGSSPAGGATIFPGRSLLWQSRCRQYVELPIKLPIKLPITWEGGPPWQAASGSAARHRGSWSTPSASTPRRASAATRGRRCAVRAGMGAQQFNPITPAREAAVYVTDLVGAAEALSDLRTRGRMSCWRSRSTRWSSSEPRGDTASWWQQRRSWSSICCPAQDASLPKARHCCVGCALTRMSRVFDPLCVQAREALLDAADALEAHLDAVV